MSYREPTKPDHVVTLALLVFIAMLVALATLIVHASSTSASLEYPVNAECFPDIPGCEHIEVLEFRGVAVAGIYKDGILSHCKNGFCLIGQEYTADGYLDTPEKLMAAVGCPDIQDAEEALAILAEYKTLEARSSLVVGERACTTMSYSSYWGASSYGGGSYPGPMTYAQTRTSGYQGRPYSPSYVQSSFCGVCMPAITIYPSTFIGPLNQHEFRAQPDPLPGPGPMLIPLPTFDDPDISTIVPDPWPYEGDPTPMDELTKILSGFLDRMDRAATQEESDTIADEAMKVAGKNMWLRSFVPPPPQWFINKTVEIYEESNGE